MSQKEKMLEIPATEFAVLMQGLKEYCLSSLESMDPIIKVLMTASPIIHDQMINLLHQMMEDIVPEAYDIFSRDPEHFYKLAKEKIDDTQESLMMEELLRKAQEQINKKQS